MTFREVLARVRQILHRRREDAGKVFISGTGRAGTTFLVELLTELGLDTGFSGEPREDAYFAEARAGYEWDLTDPNGPRIQKSPYLCDVLDEVVARGTPISCLIVPVRDIADAARSRIKVQTASTGSGDGDPVAGGLWSTAVASDQETVLRSKLSRLIESAVKHDIPMVFMHFPRFANDREYTFGKLVEVFPDLGPAKFNAAFAKVAKPELISRF
jgi:hypothetical protein